MTTSELFTTLRSLEVALWVDGDRLRYSAPKGVLDGGLLGEIRRHRGEIVGLLRSVRDAGAAPAVAPVPRGGPLAVSSGQEQLWFLDQFAPGNAAYNLPAAARLSGSLDRGALAWSFGEIVRRHETLRTTFAAVDGRPAQVVAPRRSVRLVVPVVDLGGLGAARRQDPARRLAAGEARRPFDLERGPLLRTLLVRLGAGDHLLLVTLHHIVADNWSQGVLIRELGALYRARVTGSPARLPDLPVQYPDFAAWQRRWLEGEACAGQLEFWRRQLTAVPALDLPTDRPRPSERSYRGRTRPFTLSRPLTDALHRLRQGRGVTLFMTLLAAFQALLGRYSGQRDVAVGCPVAGRGLPEYEGLIGYFVNTLVLRGDLTDDPSFAQLLERVRAASLAAYAHQDLPFARLVEELSPARDRSRPPLFQVLLALQETRIEGARLPGLTLTPVEVDSGACRFDLSLTLEERREGLHGWLEYDLELFDGTTVGRFLAHFEGLLAAVASQPGRRLSELPLLAPGQRQQLLVEANATGVAFPDDRCVDELLGERSQRWPESVAVSCEGRHLSYRHLARRAGAAGRRLRCLGVGPEARVGVSLTRSLDLLVALLGVLRAGGAYVPLDPAFPAERRVWVLADSGVGVLISEQALVSDLPGQRARLLPVSALGEAGDGEPPARPSWPESLAYVLYTSGSTGRPKGVAVSHRALVNFLCSMAQRPGLVRGDRLLAVTSLSFDIAALELYLPLLVGGRLELATAETAADGGRLRWWLAASGATALQATPATWRMLLAAGWQRDPRLMVLCGGEALPAELAASLAGDDGAVWNLYGPTETTVWSALERLAPGDAVTLGRPLANTRLHVLDRHLRPVVPGAAGELVIGGEGLARGYLGRPGTTAAGFVPDAFSPAPGARFYRTGDLARHRPDGRLEFLGRLDHQVKIRGFRIELGEVESALAAHPGVASAVVVAREEKPGEGRLVAYLVPRGERAPAAEELRSFLASRLPEYMLPGAFMALDDLPLTPNRKVDRRALPAPRWGPDRRYVAPGSPVEEVLTGIWAEVLGVERVGIHDDFFSLGGHSLLATQLVSRIRRLLGAELAVRTLFARPTVAGLAAEVAAAIGGESPAAIEAGPAGETAPLSFSQLRQWFLVQFEPGTPAYNLTFGVCLDGRLDAAILARSLREVVRRHQILRTTFPAAAGQPAQRVSAFRGPALLRVDLRALPPEERRRQARRLAGEQSRRPFDLARGPLLRVLLVRLGEAAHHLVVVVHHIVFDGWSLGILIHEVATLYRAFAAGERSPLPELPIQYADFAAWQHRWLGGEVLEQLLAYWRQRLAGVPPVLPLPLDRPRPTARRARGARRRVSLPPSLIRSLQELGSRRGVTLFMVLLAGFKALLARYTGRRDLPVGTFIANRNRPEVEDLVGFFVNTLVLRTDLAGDPSFDEVLRRVREVTLGAYAHQDLPFEKLLEELSPDREMSLSPIVQVMLVFHNAPAPALRLPGLAVRRLDLEEEPWAHFDWTLWLWQEGEGVAGYLDYDRDLFDAATMARMLGHFHRLLAAAASRPSERLDRLPLLAAAEKQQLVAEWNDRQRPEAPPGGFDALLAAQVARAPDAVAVAGQDRHHSYGEVDRRAGRLARRLRRLGAGPEARVGLFFDRSPAMVVAVVAVLRAGAAYVPVEAAAPRKRAADLFARAGVSVLVTRGELAPALPPLGAPVLDADREEAGAPGAAAAGPQPPAAPENLAYVVFTSGSTGRPKGVMVSRASLANACLAWRESYALEPGLRQVQVATFSFDVCSGEVARALATGGRLVLCPLEVLLAPERFCRLLVAEAIEVAEFVPALLRPLLRHLAAAEGAARWPRTMVVGSEAWFVRELAEAAALLPPGARLINSYGVTEATIDASWFVGEASFSDPEAAIPIGRPYANLRMHVLDPVLAPVPMGVAGELLLGGAGVARGYLGQPAMTAERFVPDPLNGAAGARLYRTGDRGRYLPDGNVEFLGRADDQIKIRGYRIEPGEVEAVLGDVPGVSAAAVMPWGEGDGKRLVAYVVAAGGGEVPGSELRSFLKQRLPDYMVPATFVPLPALPLGASGKLDRRRLPPPERDQPEAESAVRQPTNAVEAMLAGIFAQVLRLDRVGVDDNFFELGGHSLLVTQVVARVGEAIQLELPLRIVFEAPTVAELALRVEELVLAKIESFSEEEVEALL